MYIYISQENCDQDDNAQKSGVYRAQTQDEFPPDQMVESPNRPLSRQRRTRSAHLHGLLADRNKTFYESISVFFKRFSNLLHA